MLKIYSMKSFLFLLVFSCFTAFSQDVKEKIAKETCDCVSKLDIATMSSSDLELNFGLCMLEAYNNHSGQFSESEKLDFENSVQMEKFGEEIATKMLSFCSDLILKLGEGYSDDNLNENTPAITGVFEGSKIETFYTISVKESNGKITKLIVLDYFKNANLITDKLIKNNQSVTISYYETEIFDAKLNKFVPAKIVTDIIKN